MNRKELKEQLDKLEEASYETLFSNKEAERIKQEILDEFDKLQSEIYESKLNRGAAQNFLVR